MTYQGQRRVFDGGANGDYDQLAVAGHLGAAAVIDKPFRLAQVVETIDRVLAKRGAPDRR